MNILAVADLHGNFENIDLKDVDVLLLAGDIAKQKPSAEDVFLAARQIEKWSRVVPVVFVHGNHDSYKSSHGKWYDLEKVVRTPAGRFFCLDKKCPSCHVAGVKIGGIPWFQCSGEHNIKHNKREHGYKEYCERNHNELHECDVLMVHCPPAGIGMNDCDVMESIRHAAEILHPKCLICGHLHHLAGEYHQPLYKCYCVAQSPTLITFEC